MNQENKKEINKVTKVKETSEQKSIREKAELLEKIAHNKLNDAHAKVAFILNHFPNTRNNDIALVIQYWKIFDKEILQGETEIKLNQLYQLTRFNSIIRARAKIQNTFRLFLASERVRERRAELDGEHREGQVQNQPDIPLTSIFCDESGKTQEYLVIGSVWINDPYRVFKIYQSLMSWKQEQNIEYEFHFSDLNKAKVKTAIEFVKCVISEADVLGFKAFIVAKSDIGKLSIEDAIYKLHYQLVIQGLEHELNSKRIDRPRLISLTKDKDDGSDKLWLADLRQKLKTDCAAYFKDGIDINAVDTEDSNSSVFLQLADLFTGSISRVLNRGVGASMNQKDEFAENMLSNLGINADLSINDSVQDFVLINKI